MPARPTFGEFETWLADQQHKDLVRVLTAGSVDDGKSTLIGRLLYDAQVVYDDHLHAVRKDSLRWGSTGDDLDFAFLLDGLKSEREQGITIDVAYRSFSTARRRFIIADTPGHEQYTRNMATGASTCDVAVLLVDARAGALQQTRRHAFIVSLLGVRHVIVVVNKMDLCGYASDVFEKIREQVTSFAARLDITDLRFIPVSALRGDNVVERTDRMPWYRGETLLECLDTVHVASDRNLVDLRFPVQAVVRGDDDFRGVAGTLASGIVRVGDEVSIWPSGERTRVSSIQMAGTRLDEAFAPMSVVLTFEDDRDAARGDMVTHARNVPRLERDLDAMLVWMDDEPLEVGRRYFVKHGHRTLPGVVAELMYAVDVNTLRRQPVDRLEKNDVGRARVALTRAVACDPYRLNRATGGFILIDAASNRTAAAGLIVDRQRQGVAAAAPEDTATSNPDRLAGPIPRSRVTLEERVARLQQVPATVLLTGLAGSGKTTLAQALERRLFDAGYAVVMLDGRMLRETVSRDLGFSRQEREVNLDRAIGVAQVLNGAGLLCLCAFEAPSRRARARARAAIGETRFVEVHVSAPLEVCRRRDAEGLYARAEAGDIELPGINEPYEPPAAPDLELPTHELDVETCVDRLVAVLQARGLLR